MKNPIRTYERGRDYGKPRRMMRSKQFKPGDRIRFKPDKSLGTVMRVSPTTLYVHFDDGEKYIIHRQQAIHTVSLKRKPKLPNPRGIVIYAKITRIEGTKGKGSQYPGQRFFHKFKPPYPAMYGLKDGSLLIK